MRQKRPYMFKLYFTEQEIKNINLAAQNDHRKVENYIEHAVNNMVINSFHVSGDERYRIKAEGVLEKLEKGRAEIAQRKGKIIPAEGNGDVIYNFTIFETASFTHDLERMNPIKISLLKQKLKNHIYPLLRSSPFRSKGIKRLPKPRTHIFKVQVQSYLFFYEIDEKVNEVIMTACFGKEESHERLQKEESKRLKLAKNTEKLPDTPEQPNLKNQPFKNLEVAV